MKIAFTTLGCKLNFAETSTYRRILTEAGMEAAAWSSPADAYLINTCAVTEHAEKKSRNLIRKAHKLAPDAPIFVTGCYAELRAEDIRAIEGVASALRIGVKCLIVRDGDDRICCCDVRRRRERRPAVIHRIAEEIVIADVFVF